MLFKTGLTLLILLFTGCAAQHANYDYEYRLPKSLTPIIYDLKLKFSSFSQEVSGQVEIQLQCETETHYIQLHADPIFIFVEVVRKKIAIY